MTTKRAKETVDVDEDYLKELMAKEIPVLRRESFKKMREKAATDAKEASDAEAVAETENENNGLPSENESTNNENREIQTNSGKKPQVAEIEIKNTGRRKKDAVGYSDTFLKKVDGVVSHRVYITEENFQKVISFLPILSRETVISHFINNMVTHHLEFFKSEINDLIQKNYKMPSI